MKINFPWFLNLFKRHKTNPNFPFLSAKEYNDIIYRNNQAANCLSFALGLTTSNTDYYGLLSTEQVSHICHSEDVGYIDICEAFIKRARQFGYKVSHISSLDNAKGKVAFILIGFYSMYYEGIGEYKYAFHVIRKNINGTFEEKLDWITDAKKISKKRVNYWISNVGKVNYFVLDNIQYQVKNT